MAEETFKDPSVVTYLNKHFVSIRVNRDKERRIAYNYFVGGLPSTWFIAENGEKINNLPGYVPADILVKVLKYIHTDSYKTMTYEEFTK